MTVYVIADVQVTDDSWVPDYAANVHDIVAKHGGKLHLMPDNGNYPPIEITEATDFEIWGVVTHVIHQV